MTELYALDSSWDKTDEFDQGYGLSSDNELLDLLNQRTIGDDIKYYKSEQPDDDLFLSLFDTTPPPYIINNNCMWSGKYSPISASYPFPSADSTLSTAVPLAEITGNKTLAAAGIIKTEPLDDIEIQQRQNQQQQNQQTQQSMQNIAPGTSLLLNSRRTTQQQQQQTHKKSKSNSSSSKQQIPVIATTEFLRDRDLIALSASPTFGRPDTPPSLEDDATEFKHTCDLTACVMGSNNISLVDGTDHDAEMTAIKRLREDLEDPSKKTVGSSHASCSYDDLLSIIGKESNSDDAASLLDDDAISSSVSKRRDTSSPSSYPWNPVGSENVYPVQHSDHSYTRSQDGIDDMSPNLETPSDSDEEIDVVSIGDKKLPTNPSDKDRRALQTKVANKFVARIVKTPSGIRTIPPRRRTSYELPYTPASVSPIKSGSSLANSRYPSPASTPYSCSQYSSSSSSSSSSSKFTPRWSTSLSRKRHATNCSIRTGGGGSNGITITGGSNSDDFMPASKRHRGKKQKTTPANVSIKRHFSLDEVDTMEKRNLHNDMERQRRIGLKNLFEALKKLIPSIKDKERAPKVNILREAAKLCETLTRDEQHLSDQKDMLKVQLRKRQEILKQLRLKHNAARAC